MRRWPTPIRILLPREFKRWNHPKTFTGTLWGLGKKLWSKDSGDGFIKQERDSW